MRQNGKTWFSKAFYWLPLLIWMAVIFNFSSQSHSQQNIKPWLQKNISEKSVKAHFSSIDYVYAGKEINIAKQGVLEFVQFNIRKGAHIVEYGVLGILLFRALKRDTNITSLKLTVLSLACCMIYASTDEFHQIFSKNRTPSVTDVLLDSISALLGILLSLWLIRENKVKGHPERYI